MTVYLIVRIDPNTGYAKLAGYSPYTDKKRAEDDAVVLSNGLLGHAHAVVPAEVDTTGFEFLKYD